MGQLMTNEKALQKWCRHTRGLDYHGYDDDPGTVGASVNRNKHDSNRCKGSGCASWDWWDEEKLGGERRGYCGADHIKPNRVGNGG